MANPRLIVHNIASVDGRLTLAPDVLLLYGDPRWAAAAGPSEGIYSRLMDKYHPQALLEGSGSLVLPGQPIDTLPAVEGETAGLYRHFLPEAVIRRPGGVNWFTVVDSGGRVRWLYKEFPSAEFAGWHLLVLVSRRTPAEYLAYLQRETIPYLVAGEGEQVDLGCALEALNEILGVTCVVSTGGGRLNGALLRAGLVDEVDLEFFPALIGGKDTPALFDGPALTAEEAPTRLALLASEILPEGRVRLHYRVAAETD